MLGERGEPRALELGAGARAVVVSDLFLTPVSSETSTTATLSLARLLDGCEPGSILVVAGNLFDLTDTTSVRSGIELDEHGRDTFEHEIEPVAASLLAHRELADSCRRLLCRHQATATGGQVSRIVVLPGTKDRSMLFDRAVQRSLAAAGFEIAESVELRVVTDAGTRSVLVEPGWRYDERNAFSDPSNPLDTPLGYHVSADLLPRVLSSSSTGWLEGIDRLADQTRLPRFLGSRLSYRKLARFAWGLTGLVVLGVAVDHLPALWLAGVSTRIHPVAPRLEIGALSLVIALIVVATIVGYANHRLWSAIGRSMLGQPGSVATDAAHESARSLCEADDVVGLVTGHSLTGELLALEGGFYANTGACCEVVEERASPIGLPPVFVSSCQVSILEVRGGTTVSARLLRSRRERPPATLLERLAILSWRSDRRARPAPGCTEVPCEVAAYPEGAPWPPIEDQAPRLRAVRRLASAGIALAAVLDLISALTPLDLRGRLHPLLHYIPLGVSETAGALVALAGVALLGLARGVRRGQRVAWTVAVLLLSGTIVAHLVKDDALLASLATALLLGFLLVFRDCFAARSDRPSLRSGLAILIGTTVAVTVLGATTLLVTLPLDPDGITLSLPSALGAVAGRLVGIDTIRLPPRVDLFLDPALLAAGIGILVVALVLASRPVVGRHGTARHPDELERAREIVLRHGSGTLDYFALRTDKQRFFGQGGVVAYGTYGGVCLVSPDPVCPIEERAALWASFRRFADAHGWAVGVLAGSAEWLPIYRSSGMRELYYGDEALVDVRAFRLDGGAKKGLRQAVNRIANHGYTITFHDPSTVGPELQHELRELMTRSRRGEAERGFSMMLGRIFDPRDQGLLLAVAHNEGGRAVALCQYLPAPGVRGYSLDLMRRDLGEHPNGLFDFVLVSTIEKLRADGYHHLGLNFATMRAVLAGESGDGLSQRVERWLFRRMSDSMQIESLWRFNAKFDPIWLARYLVFDSTEQSLATGLAIARAESLWEIPVLGRFLVPDPEPDRSALPAPQTSTR